MNVLPEILSTIAATKGCNTIRSKIGQDMEQQILTIIVTLKLLTLSIGTGLSHINRFCKMSVIYRLNHEKST